jgi:GNAT superfamily N-acetyltransferase
MWGLRPRRVNNLSLWKALRQAETSRAQISTDKSTQISHDCERLKGRPQMAVWPFFPDTPMSAPRIRPAAISDIDALDAIERSVFVSDRISRRSFRTLIDRPTAETHGHRSRWRGPRLCHDPVSRGRCAGPALLAGRRPGQAGKGYGRALLSAAETAAMEHDRILLRLEVREDNEAAITLYKNAGYRRIGRVADYYEDGMAALRFENSCAGPEAPDVATPFYEQTADFTCGSACLLMALARFRSPEFLDPVWEIRLWREATTVFMLSGPGGCEPFGLAMVAREHGLDPEVWCSTSDMLFLETVRDPEKRRVMELAQTDFRSPCRRGGNPGALPRPSISTGSAKGWPRGMSPSFWSAAI